MSSSHELSRNFSSAQTVSITTDIHAASEETVQVISSIGVSKAISLVARSIWFAGRCGIVLSVDSALYAAIAVFCSTIDYKRVQ